MQWIIQKFGEEVCFIVMNVMLQCTALFNVSKNSPYLLRHLCICWLLWIFEINILVILTPTVQP